MAKQAAVATAESPLHPESEQSVPATDDADIKAQLATAHLQIERMATVVADLQGRLCCFEVGTGCRKTPFSEMVRFPNINGQQAVLISERTKELILQGLPTVRE